MSRKTLRIRVTGRVQGVWFRGWTRGEAERLGLDGWVRNAADGSVEAVTAGPGAAVDAMLAALHRGPELARVDGVEVAASGEAVPAGFVIAR